jgi:tetratricopeptide (TPR) repeat protein
MGAGMTAGAVARHPVESLSIVDLVDSLVRSAPFFARQNHDVLDNPKARFVVEDGRNFLLTAEERYDLVISDIFFPAGAGTGSLYSLEHYRLARSRLRGGGAMVQWLPLYQLSEDEFKIVAATFREAFPHVELWLGDPDLMYPVVGLVGRNESESIDLERLRERMGQEEVSRDLVYGDDPFSLLGAFLLGKDGIEEYVGEAPLNTNDRPLIEFSAPRNNYSNRRLGWESMQRLAALKTSVASLLDLDDLATAERDEIVRRVEATEQGRIHYYRGSFALGEGRSEEGYQEYRQARSLAPQDAFVDFHTSESIGRLQARLGNPERAVTLLESAVALRPDEIEPRLLLADLYARRERWEIARRHLSEVLQIYPEHAAAYSRLGEIYSSQERWEEAESAFTRSLGIMPVEDPRIRRLHDHASERMQALRQR